MSYQFDWYLPDKALSLTIIGNYTVEDAQEVNQLIVDELNKSKTPLVLIIDATKMSRPFNFSNIRSTQVYMDHPKLRSIFVAAQDRLVKLSMMVIFNLSRTQLVVLDDLDRVVSLLKRQMVEHS